MLYKKKWTRRRHYRVHGYYDHVFVGWFLLGVIPLFIYREGYSR